MQTNNEQYLNRIKVAKRNFYIFAAATLLIPLLTLAFLVGRIISLEKSMIKIKATTKAFTVASAGKGRPKYDFKVAEYPVTFSRAYHGIFKSSPKDRITAIYGHMPIFTDADTTSAQVSFYIAAEDRTRLSQGKEEITWFYLSPAKSADPERKGFYWDLYLYVSQTNLFFGLSTFACILTGFTCIMAFYWSTQVSIANPRSGYFIIAMGVLLLIYLFITL